MHRLIHMALRSNRQMMTRTSLFSFHSTSELNSFRTISAASDSTGKVDFTTDTVNPDHIQISDSTVKRLKKVAESGEFLRVMIDSGGCKGFNYVFKLDTQLQPDDRVFERDNAKVVVDADSLEFLKGSTIDYSEELIRSSFRVLSNPQMKEGCSCGSSFAPKF